VRPTVPTLHVVYVRACQDAKVTAASLAHLNMRSSNIQICATACYGPCDTPVLSYISSQASVIKSCKSMKTCLCALHTVHKTENSVKGFFKKVHLDGSPYCCEVVSACIGAGFTSHQCQNLRMKAFLVDCGHAGACQHALGYHDQAVHDYEKAFSIDSGNKEKVPDEARSQQFLAFYQKELALYIRKHLDDPVLSFCLDKELHPIFKVWEACQAAHFKRQPLNPKSALNMDMMQISA